MSSLWEWHSPELHKFTQHKVDASLEYNPWLKPQSLPTVGVGLNACQYCFNNNGGYLCCMSHCSRYQSMVGDVTKAHQREERTEDGD